MAENMTRRAQVEAAAAMFTNTADRGETATIPPDGLRSIGAMLKETAHWVPGSVLMAAIVIGIAFNIGAAVLLHGTQPTYGVIAGMGLGGVSTQTMVVGLIEAPWVLLAIYLFRTGVRL